MKPGGPPPPRPPRPSRPLIVQPDDPRRDPTDPPPDDPLTRTANALERIARILEERLPEAPMRDRLISQHDAEAMVATATKSERVRGIVQRTALEAGGRLLLWALGIAGALLIAGVVGYGLRDCATRGAPVTPSAHP